MISSWQESYDKPRQCVVKQKHYSAYKCSYRQGCGLPSGHVWLWELDQKEGRKPENWCFWTVVLEKTPESPWTAGRSNLSILREINPEYSLEELMLKLKLQYFGHLMQTVNWLGKFLMLGKIEGRRRRGYQRMRWLDGITDAMDMNLGKLLEMVKDREAWHAAVQGVTELDMTGQRNNNIIVLVCTKHQRESAIGLPIQASVWWSECCRELGKYIAVWGLKKLKCVLFCKPSSTLPGTEL